MIYFYGPVGLKFFPVMGFLKGIGLYLRMIRISHSVFALPFAFTSALMAADGIPSAWQVFWVVVAMVGARSGAMGLNRVIDRNIDALNPRTREREIPAGKIKPAHALAFALMSLALMVLSAYMLNPLCFKLSPLAIFVLVVYSYCKRFTWAAHMVLGVALSLAPLGAWAAVKGTLDLEVLPLVLSVVFWLPGFDIIYALMDIDFDRSSGLQSIPAKFGIRRSLALAKVLHALALGCLVITGMVFDLGGFYWLGMIMVAGLFVYEHSLVKHDDLSRIYKAFNLNGYIGAAVFVFTLLDYLIL